MKKLLSRIITKANQEDGHNNQNLPGKIKSCGVFFGAHGNLFRMALIRIFICWSSYSIQTIQTALNTGTKEHILKQIKLLLNKVTQNKTCEGSFVPLFFEKGYYHFKIVKT